MFFKQNSTSSFKIITFVVVEHTTYKNAKKTAAAYASQILPLRFRLMVPHENFHMNETISRLYLL